MRAYVFITTQGDARPIVEKIRAIKGVKEADALWGPIDIIALVEADDVKALIDLVPVKIRKIPGVIEHCIGNGTRPLRLPSSPQSPPPTGERGGSGVN